MEQESSDTSTSIKCVVIGDDSFEKTLLCLSFANQSFPSLEEEPLPKLDHYSCRFVLPQDRRINFELWNTAGQEEHPRLRPLTYCDTNVFVICYSVDHRKTFENVETLWIPEISHHAPNVCPWFSFFNSFGIT